jgi:hypothetical protein
MTNSHWLKKHVVLNHYFLLYLHNQTFSPFFNIITVRGAAIVNYDPLLTISRHFFNIITLRTAAILGLG